MERAAGELCHSTRPGLALVSPVALLVLALVALLCHSPRAGLALHSRVPDKPQVSPKHSPRASSLSPQSP